MSKRNFLIIAGLLALAGLLWLGNFYWKNLRGIGPVLKPPPKDITDASFNTTGLPLSLPPGFLISIFAKDLPGARVMLPVGVGMYVSQTSEGKISYLRINNGEVVSSKVGLKNLNNPHGLAYDPDTDDLYFAEENKITRVRLGTEQAPKKIMDLPSGAGHFTRTIGFGKDGRLYVSIGSSCNVCIEKDPRRAAIYSMNKDGSDFKEYASGLRNSVFFTWDSVGRMWATEMGRDYLGDDLPPDEVNIIEEGRDYGWPNCYGKRVLDDKFFENSRFGPPSSICDKTEPTYIDLQAHSAPLGLAFVPKNSNWPKEYWNNLLVAYHGSWNRSTPTGYKIVRIRLDDQGNYQGTEDFVTGWLAKDGALGRPADLFFDPIGNLYVSDDKAGVIYQIVYLHPDKIKVTSPKPSRLVQSPLIIEGEARGNWYFEGSFPVKLLDGNGQVIARAAAQSQGDWMTENFVPFKVSLEFPLPATDLGILVLEKDNPSELPENATELRIPVRFR